MKPPALFAPSLLQRRAVVGGESDWTWHEIHAAAAELAPRLEPGLAVCNLCATRAGFLVTWLAALRRGCLMLLPPSGGQADLLSLLHAGGGALVVVDRQDLALAADHGAVRCLVHVPTVPARLPAPCELAWTPDAAKACACLYTSGTTGAPQPQFKTWEQLLLGAQALAARLAQLAEGGMADWHALVSSVPPQHMFGFESSVMLPLATGLAVVDRKPLLPLDVRAAMQRCGGAAAWVATPLHLRALARSGVSLPDCRLALVSTMPLAPALAAQVEALVHAPVLELFGSTETGALATRRAALAARWQPIGDARLEAAGATTSAWGAHFPSPHVLGDQVDLGTDGSFELLGRHADMVKIGGRRASLSALNLLLQDLPGLQDGVFYLPATDSPTERLVLIHAGALDRDAAERWLRGRIDPVFLPRAFVQVPRLPRDANGKLPGAALQALHASRGKPAADEGDALDFEFIVAHGHPCLPGHFPGQPIVPGVVILDRVLAHLRERTGREVQRLPRVKFSAPLRPGQTACVRFTCRDDTLSFRVSTGDAQAPDTIAQGSVQLQQRPGERTR
jgi:acyl-coenzyme A synthetase/AMP-(fatty) acid ligase/3-hydroxymyristoyl/3-hydroxydecanoyl-(acyl carrier protein) dehydratase